MGNALGSTCEVPIKFYFKEDAPSLTHDRFLQTDSVPISFSKGFDCMDEDGTLHRCAVKIDNGAYEHRQEYRNLKDAKPPIKAKTPVVMLLVLLK